MAGLVVKLLTSMDKVPAWMNGLPTYVHMQQNGAFKKAF